MIGDKPGCGLPERSPHGRFKRSERSVIVITRVDGVALRMREGAARGRPVEKGRRPGAIALFRVRQLLASLRCVLFLERDRAIGRDEVEVRLGDLGVQLELACAEQIARVLPRDLRLLETLLAAKAVEQGERYRRRHTERRSRELEWKLRVRRAKRRALGGAEGDLRAIEPCQPSAPSDGVLRRAGSQRRKRARLGAVDEK